MENLRARLQTLWTKRPTSQKLVIAVVGCLFLAVFIFAMFYGLEGEYRLLFRDLEPEDASQISDFLKQEQIPYKLSGEGRTILVPEYRLYDIRLQLAGKGLPKNKVPGFELFDQNNLGMSEFVQQINYTRALQGELGRTISRLEGLNQAVVHIARPKPSIFQRKPQAVTASVILHIKRGYAIDQRKIYGIAYLVTSAVEGLTIENVTILDQHGQLLFQKQAGGIEPVVNQALEMKKGVEEYLKEKAQTMLDEILGKDKSLVRINVDLDYNSLREVHETYNPENQTVQSETVRTHKIRENMPEGVKLKKADSNKQKEEQEENKDTRYALDKVIKEIESKPGTLKRVSLAIVVDQSLAGQVDQIGKLVQESVGFEPKRGDTSQTVAISFTKPAETKEAEGLPFWQNNYQLVSLLVKSGVVALAIIVLGFVLLSLAGGRPKKQEAKAKEAILPIKESPGSIPVVSSLDSTVQQVRQIAKENPESVSALLHQWFNEESAS